MFVMLRSCSFPVEFCCNITRRTGKFHGVVPLVSLVAS